MKPIPLGVDGWTYTEAEVSAGVYQVVATDGVGHRFEETGTDPDGAIERARTWARSTFQASAAHPIS